MVALVLFLSVLSSLSCVHQPAPAGWDEPLLGDEAAGSPMLPLFSQPRGQSGQWSKSKKPLSKDEKKLYWKKSPGSESESKVWKKNLKQRLQAFSRRWVLPPQLPMHRKPSRRSEVVGQLLQGDIVWVQSISENWARLRSGAWVPAKNLSTVPPDPLYLQRPASDLLKENVPP